MGCMIYSPVGIDIPTNEQIEGCWDRTGDGAGFSYWDSDMERFVVKKSLSFKKFMKKLGRLGNPKDLSIVMHFRKGSVGDVSDVNVQPIIVQQNRFVIAHTGILEPFKDKKNKASDTNLFAKHALKHLHLNRYCDSPGVWRIIRGLGGLTNTFAFQFVDGKGKPKTILTNRQTWSNVDGMLVSSRYYLTGKTSVPATTTNARKKQTTNTGNKLIVLGNCHFCNERTELTEVTWEGEYTFYLCADCIVSTNNITIN